MHKVKYNLLKLELVISCKGPLLIKSGGISVNPSLPDMQFVRTHLPQKGEEIYIPGSSLKGVIRSYVERVLRTKKGNSSDGACNPFEKEQSCTYSIEQKEREIERKQKRKIETYEIYALSCRACKMFGNTKLKSRISFLDAYPEGNIHTETRYGVAISRLTHSVAQGPFEMEVAISGSFKTKLYLDNFEAWQIGLIALSIQSLNDGMLRIGYGKNRGFGEVGAKVKDIEFSFSKPSLTNQILGIGKLAAKEESEKYGFNNYKPDEDYFQVEAEGEDVEEVLYTTRKYKSEDWEKIASSAISHLKGILT